ncbi:MAG: hypothetical protein U0800_03560 [Isosphaeraceae bacterium]
MMKKETRIKDKFLTPAAIAEIRAMEVRANAIRRREGLTDHPLRFVPCGCPDPNCGGWYSIDENVTIPTAHACRALLAADNLARKPPRDGHAGPVE